MKAELDDDVAIVRLVEGLSSVGLTVSNDGRGGLRIHNAERLANVISLDARKRALDEAMRSGMSRVFGRVMLENGEIVYGMPIHDPRDEPPKGAV